MIKEESIYPMIKMIYDKVTTVSKKYDSYICTKGDIVDLYINGKIININFTIDNIHFGKSWIAILNNSNSLYIIDKKNENNITKISNICNSHKQNVNHDQFSLLYLTKISNTISKFMVVIINNKDYRIIKIFDNVLRYSINPISYNVDIVYTDDGKHKEASLKDLI